ncbi:hypothetical protein ILUMI_06689 [Ignelater luminosus]|uniref:Factor VIII intron 22 protein n=1 Tax=Ignelater luminosus TaxID=2038154 RepID=A0A8K0GHI3_IGNLU|nr:hypothetical protein ILUMI_06689 [Ignelater luminosus]
MSVDSSGTDILDQYKHISNKLKKRFLRKPNVTEACDSFTSLGQYCENIEMPSYAGMCWIAAARCEGSLGNIPGETSCLVRSARNFVLAEVKNKSLGCQSVSDENLQAALSCYAHARTRLPESCPLATGINLEIVESLNKLDINHANEMYLKDAVDLSQNSLDIKVHCLELLASNYIERGDYTAALDTFTEITNLLENLPPNGTRSDVLLNCEVSRIFLLLILRPAPQKLAPHFTKLLETFTWGDKNDSHLNACCMSEELFLLLQSLVITCQSLDTSSLPYLEGCMWPHLTTDQKVFFVA